MPEDRLGCIEKIDPPRRLTPWERETLELLLPDGWPDRIAELEVHEGCTCGCASVSFRPTVRQHHLVAEASGADADGMTIWVLLFGHPDHHELDEVDVQRADGRPIIQLPVVEELVRNPSAK